MEEKYPIIFAISTSNFLPLFFVFQQWHQHDFFDYSAKRSNLARQQNVGR